MRTLARCAAIIVMLVGLAPETDAAPRSVLIRWRYRPPRAFTGVALYHARTAEELAAGENVTRIDLGVGPPGTAIDEAWVPGFDDSRDYHIALRVFDDYGNESQNSNTGVIRAVSLPETVLHFDGFESYSDGQDPDGWVDTAGNEPGPASLFETVELADGTVAFGTTSDGFDLHSHFATEDSQNWTGYQYSGRLKSDALLGASGVTFLSEWPSPAFYYRLARNGSDAYALDVRDASELSCRQNERSTGVVAAAGEWLRFRVVVTRFENRNRIRASLWPDGEAAPAGFQIDCWDRRPQVAEAGHVGVYSSEGAGNFWDDLEVRAIENDGAPPDYEPDPDPEPEPEPGYASAARLVHWWRLGRDPAALGRDFALRSPIDAAQSRKRIGAQDLIDGGSDGAYLDLDGRRESLGNKRRRFYGVGDSWTLAVWVRPDEVAGSKYRYIVDLNGRANKRGRSRIALLLDESNRFALEVSDAQQRTRGLSAGAPIAVGELGSRWYHVVVRKAGDLSLALYVDGVLAAQTDIGVPLQSDVERLLRLGARVASPGGRYFSGGLHSVALWDTALGAAEIGELAESWWFDLNEP